MTLDDVIALSPRAKMHFGRDAYARLEGTSIQDLPSMGVDVVEDSTAVLCAFYLHVLPRAPRYVRSLVQHDLFTAVAFWLRFLGPHFRGTYAHADLEAPVQLLTDLWTTIAENSEQPIEEVASMLIAGHLIGCALSDAWNGRPLLGRVERDLTRVVQSPLFAALSTCERLHEMVREARRLCFGDATR